MRLKLTRMVVLMCDIAPFGMRCIYEEHADELFFCCGHRLRWQWNEMWSNTIILKHFIEPYRCPDFEIARSDKNAE